jgi:hypothetical protein
MTTLLQKVDSYTASEYAFRFYLAKRDAAAFVTDIVEEMLRSRGDVIWLEGKA